MTGVAKCSMTSLFPFKPIEVIIELALALELEEILLSTLTNRVSLTISSYTSSPFIIIDISL